MYAPSQRQFKRSTAGVIAGVCAGLAEYFGTNLVFTRVVFILLALANGFGVLLYLILLLIMRTPSISTTPPIVGMPPNYAPPQRRTFVGYIIGFCGMCASFATFLNNIAGFCSFFPICPGPSHAGPIVPAPPITSVVTTVPVPTIDSALEQKVLAFLRKAAHQEELARQNSNAAYLEGAYADEALAHVQDYISELQAKGFYDSSTLQRNWIVTLRTSDDTHIQVDTCEVWESKIYRISDGTLVEEAPQHLTPQTIQLEYRSGRWYITRFTFYDPPHFCG